MTRERKNKKAALLTGALFVLALGLLLFSTIGGARAALNPDPQTFSTFIHTDSIGISLSGDEAAQGTYLSSGKQWYPGKENAGVLSVANDGEIDEYVRVTLYRSWYDPQKRATDTGRDPSLIDLQVTGDWIRVDSENKETITLYYPRPLTPGESVAVMDGVTVSSSVTSVMDVQ